MNALHALNDVAMLAQAALGARAVGIIFCIDNVASIIAQCGLSSVGVNAAAHLMSRSPQAKSTRVVAITTPALRNEGYEQALISAAAAHDGSGVARTGVFALYGAGDLIPSDTSPIEAAVRQAKRHVTQGTTRFSVNAEHYDRLAEMTDSLLCVAGLDGYLKQLNGAWTRVLGWSADELTSQPYINFIHPDDVQRTMDEAAALLSERDAAVEFENRYRCKNGSYRWLSWNTRASRDEGLLYCVVSDVTDRVRLRDEVTASKQLLEKTARIARVGGWSVDLATKAVHWSQVVREIHEVTDDYVADLDEAINFYPPESRHIITAAIDEALETGKPWDVEVPFITAKGRRRQVRAAGEPVTDAAGACVQLRGFFQDITARTQAEKAKREFVSTVSHELRTPLTSIRGSLRLIESGVMGEIPLPAHELITIASNNVERLVRLINDILDLDKLEAGRMALQLQPTPLRPLVERVVQSFQSMADEAGVRLSMTTEAPDPSLVEVPTALSLDPDRIEQVVANLLSNAIKFSPRDSVVDISIGARRHTFRVSVSDQGPGISASDQPRIFERFQQLDSSDTRSAGGTGLGLAISKAIVEQHGGHIGLTSTLGVGSTFWFGLQHQAGATTDSEREKLQRTGT